MAELFSNAFEHGVLGLSSELKSSTEGFTKYYQLREERMQNIGDGSVCFVFDHSPVENGGKLVIQVIDSGDGFDYKEKEDSDFKAQGYSGRGIPLIRSICESLKYSGNGNTVEVTLRWDAEETE